MWSLGQRTRIGHHSRVVGPNDVEHPSPSHERLDWHEVLLDDLRQVVVVVDRCGCITVSSPAARKRCAALRVGASFVECLVEGDRAVALLATRAHAPSEIRLHLRSDLTAIAELWTVRPLDSGGVLLRVAEAERETTEFHEQLARALSHDFGAGIRHVDSFAKLLRTDEAVGRGGEADQWISHLCAGAERLHHFKVGVIEFLRVDSRPCRPDPQPLQPLVDAATVLVPGVEVVGRTEAVVRGEGPPIQRVFEHLFRNSVVHGALGTARVQISVRLGGDRVTVSVRDYGPGVDEACRSHIFEPFFSRGAGRGLGLGLAFCRSVIHRHGGRLTLAESDGGGLSLAFDFQPA